MKSAVPAIHPMCPQWHRALDLGRSGRTRAAWIALATLFLTATGAGAEPSPQAPEPEQIRAAIERTLPLVQKSATEYLKQRECFGCHHQATSVFVLSEAGLRGFDVDRQVIDAQLERTKAHLAQGRSRYLSGKGTGGQADTAGWALWTLDVGGQASDETTQAVVEYLLGYQADRDHYRPPSRRPPMESSHFTTSYVALRGLEAFGSDEQREKIDARKKQVLKWMQDAEVKETEDRVFRLRAFGYLGAEPKSIRAAAKALLDTQQADGGWRQLDEGDSDAYATGTALVALRESGQLAATDEAYVRGLKYLLAQQHDDGSWHVKTRSRPIQTYFESGFPHAKDQFISMAGTCWATMALLEALPEQPADQMLK